MLAEVCPGFFSSHPPFSLLPNEESQREATTGVLILLQLIHAAHEMPRVANSRLLFFTSYADREGSGNLTGLGEVQEARDLQKSTCNEHRGGTREGEGQQEKSAPSTETFTAGQG